MSRRNDIAICNAQFGRRLRRCDAIFDAVDPYRSQPPSEDRLADLLRVEAAKSNVRGVRHLLTTLCALFSIAPFVHPHALSQFASAVWAASGLMALVCLIEERRLGRVRIRELRKLGL